LGANVDPIEWLDTLCALLQSELPRAEFDQFHIFPDRKGVFHCSHEVFMDDIPAPFKTDHFAVIGTDFRSTLLHPGMKSVSLAQRKTLADVGSWIEQVFPSNIADKSVNWKSFERLAYFLVHVCPPPSANCRHTKVLQLLRELLPQECKDLARTELPAVLPGSWDRPLRVSLIPILAEIAKAGSIDGLRAIVPDPVTSLHILFDVLLVFADVPVERIYPNEHGVFCERRDLRAGNQISADLKDILRDLSEGRNDIRTSLVDCQFLDKIPNLPEVPLDEVCRDIDRCIIGAHIARPRKEGKFAAPLRLLHQNWFHRPDFPVLFPYFKLEEASIMYDMVLSAEKRDVLLMLSGLPAELLQEVARFDRDQIRMLLHRKPVSASTFCHAQSLVWGTLAGALKESTVVWLHKPVGGPGPEVYYMDGPDYGVDIEVTTPDGIVYSIVVIPKDTTISTRRLQTIANEQPKNLAFVVIDGGNSHGLMSYLAMGSSFTPELLRSLTNST
jgi:hypothetical protein